MRRPTLRGERRLSEALYNASGTSFFNESLFNDSDVQLWSTNESAHDEWSALNETLDDWLWLLNGTNATNGTASEEELMDPELAAAINRASNLRNTTGALTNVLTLSLTTGEEPVAVVSDQVTPRWAPPSRPLFSFRLPLR